MREKFVVKPSEIPNEITIVLSEKDKCLFAQMLTDFMISAEDAGSNYRNIYRKGLKMVYNKYYPEDKVY
ncbi:MULTISPECIES: hypothetical protein [Bacillus]|uniref:hypothetical protein n=1 Tax=Bacillus TaxID=1386 RepID=UPI0005E8BD39|nr:MULTISPECIES: hypothetical protein [Bacillus]KXI71786.1 hypothetical protein ACS51_03755 [Bacillus cereus]CKF85562.1 Uncharacterised protein [Streptococcus pneumoniae]MDC7739800.1 hypothetical protein [Bacillus sp. FF-1]CKF15737.1 Uncharacterised protein [Bacillus paranthracis]CKG25090.1 Uncharacterised protein [Streptococcus pneumoniae]